MGWNYFKPSFRSLESVFCGGGGRIFNEILKFHKGFSLFLPKSELFSPRNSPAIIDWSRQISEELGILQGYRVFSASSGFEEVIIAV